MAARRAECIVVIARRGELYTFMSTMPALSSPQPRAVQRQSVLPLSKAVEIAWKSIRMRLSRSLLVTSGIVLALTFLMSIRVKDAMIAGMREWSQTAGSGSGFTHLRWRQADLDRQMRQLVSQQVLPAMEAAKKHLPLGAGAPRFDARAAWGMDLAELQKEVGSLPAPMAAIEDALSVDPSMLKTLNSWLEIRREQKQIVNQLTGPQNLVTLLRSNGEAVTDAGVASERSQTRWLLGLALLVAFVGILNAMLMSVTERFREIGTMKCLGALDSFIIKLFLIESLFQGLVGTLAGILLGLSLSILSIWGTYAHYTWENPQWGSIAASAGTCVLVGVGLTVAGALYPAWQAARMQPIEAMRAEA